MYGVESRRNLAFSAVVKTSFEQTLACGNATHAVTHSRQARDSEGRTMMELARGCAPGKDGQLHPMYSVDVDDPVAKTSVHL
jgi:hypothetical protein